MPFILPSVFPKYAELTSAITILSIGVIPSTLVMIFTSELLGIEKSKFVLIGESIAFVTIVIGIVTLGSLMGIEGLAISFVLGFLFQSVYLVVLNRYQKSKTT